jgi:hypothetical protein
MTFSQAQSRGRLLRFLVDNLGQEIESGSPAASSYIAINSDSELVLTGITHDGSGPFTESDGSNAYTTSSINIGSTDTPSYTLDVDGTFRAQGGVILGDADSDITTVTSQLTASEGAYFADRVGIGGSAPHYALVVTGATHLSYDGGSADANLVIHEDANDAARLQFTNTADTSGPYGNSWDWTFYGKSAAEGSPQDAALNFSYGDADGDGTGQDLLKIRGDGVITTPLQPAVYAHRNEKQGTGGALGTGWNTVKFNDVIDTYDTLFDVGGDLNTTTGVFTAPAAGKYLISTEVMLSNIPADDDGPGLAYYIMLKCITTKSAADALSLYAARQNVSMWSGSGDYNHLQVPGTWLVNMDANDTAYIQVVSNNADGDTYIYGASTTTYTNIKIVKVS